MARRLENLEPERQKRLFETAAEEFAAHGFDGASLNRILEKSGMSKSSLYYYFDDKADLFVTLIERSMAVLFREIGGFDPATLDAEGFWARFEDLYRRAIAREWKMPTQTDASGRSTAASRRRSRVPVCDFISSARQ